MRLPESIENEEQLEQLLTTPSAELIESCQTWADPLVILGAGGKMGPTLAVLARRAVEQAGKELRVIATSRFRNAEARQWLEDRGVETRSVDIFDRRQLAELPDSPNVVYLVGMKFGTSTDPVPTWATNTVAPVHACERFSGARIVALSTGNVYPLSDVTLSGSCEADPLTPIGEYANAAVARERIFQYYAADRSGTNDYAGAQASRVALLRLNYAHDLRYGVITDLAQRIWQHQPIDVSMGYFNAIWQGDANEVILRSFSLCDSPARAINLTGPQICSVRSVVEKLGELLGREPELVGHEAPTALLSDTTVMQAEFGAPRVPLERMLVWIAHWTRSSGRTLGKPTHFENRDGNF